MKLKNLTPFVFAVVLIGLVALGPVAMMAATTIVVKPSMMDGWRFRTA